MTTFDVVLSEAVSSGASDVYFLEGVAPAIKVDGLVSPVAGADALDAAGMRGILERLLPVRERTAFAEAGEANLSHMHPILGRFRVNCYRAMGVSGAVLRRVKTEVPTLESLELPPLLGSLVLERQGLILLVGATGAGKSTTVAAMLHHRITRSRGHVVTIEDPVEFLHDSDQSIVSQREVGIDTESYLVGLRNALRQAPDVIFVGELRDPETVAVALHSAETGHLVVSTLHATNATTAIERLLNFFQPRCGPRRSSSCRSRYVPWSRSGSFLGSRERAGPPPPRSCWSRPASRR
jgi:twitching motility protein PilU